MSGLLDDLMSQLGSGGVSQIAGALGVDDGLASKAIGMALPAILGGLANNAAKPDGAAALSTALGSHNDGILGQLGSLLGGDGPGAGILGHVLGNKQQNVEQNLAGQSGLDLGSIAKLLPILAPLVMGLLSKRKQDNALDDGGLGSFLTQERSAVEKKNPGLGGLAAILDADGDGSIIDDVMGMASGNKDDGGGMGGLLGKILGG